MKASWLLVVPAAVLALMVPAASRADDPPGGCGAEECFAGTPVVPSFDPQWSESFVPPPLPRLRAATTACIPTDIVVYAPTDWVRFAQRMRLNMSPCANYYVSIPPIASDKTKPRGPLQAPQIRALGPNFHAVNEINVTAATSWKDWVAAVPGRTWYDAGVEARRRMDDPSQGNFDPTSGDIWAVNELTSAVRQGVGVTRQNMRDLVHGLYDGAGGPQVKGIVWTSGISQATTFLDTYRNNVNAWLGDSAFFSDMSQYVRFWSQEVYGRFDRWAAPGSTPQDRLGPTADYLEHYANLGAAGSYETGDTSAYIETADAPDGNAAWSNSNAYEWPSPAVDYVSAANYMTAQVYAFRHAQAARPSESFGFVWSPTSPPGMTANEFTKEGNYILDRIAAAIHTTDAPSTDPGLAACGEDLSLCSGDYASATFNTAWRIFNDWTQPSATAANLDVQQDTPRQLTLQGLDPDPGQTLTYTIDTQPLHGTAATTADGTATYVPAPGYHGPDAFTFRVDDGWMSSTAVVTIDVNAPPTVSLAAAGPVDEGGSPITLSASASDPDGDPVAVTWQTTAGTLNANGTAATFSADDGPAVATITMTADDGRGGTASAAIDVTIENVPPTADAGADLTGTWGVPVAFSGTATDPSPVDAKSLAVQWSFGDGATSTDLQPTHVYADPGTYTATLTVTDKDGGVASDTTTVVVGARQASLATTVHSTLDRAHATVAASFGDALGGGRLAGHALTFSLGTAACTATTTAAGAAACTLPSPSLGPSQVTARFDGDTLYDGASASSPTLVYGLPDGGVFVVGDGAAHGAVTFWSQSWWLLNTLTGGAAPASFKGFATPGPNGLFARPGFVGAPPTVPEWMAIEVATQIAKDGSSITASAKGMVIVHVDAYDPALAGRGTVIASVS
ncbi:MAG TPA: PKD domain-containing protein [Gaiellaceae bacterium]